MHQPRRLLRVIEGGFVLYRAIVPHYQIMPAPVVLIGELGLDAMRGERFTMADIPSGSLTHRWFTWTPKEALPAHPNVGAWYERLAYQEHVIQVNAKRTQEIAAAG